MPIFQLNTNESPARPTVLGTWNGTDYDPPSGWFETPQTSTTTQYTVAQWLKLPGQAPYTIVPLGNPLLVALRLPVVPPTTTGFRMTYGRTDSSRNPAGSARRTDETQLAVGLSHTFQNVQFPSTTGSGQYYYITLPTGFTLTSVIDTISGEVIADWSQSGQTWTYSVRRRGTQVGFTITVRRDS